MNSKYVRSTVKLNSFLILFLILSSCTVRLIAPYDEVTDKKVSDLQEKVVTKFIAWEREIPSIENAQPFYDEVDAVLEILILRNQNIDNSQIIVTMLEKVKENFSTLYQLHLDNDLNVETIRQIKPDINVQFNAIQKLQMQLKKAEE